LYSNSRRDVEAMWSGARPPTMFNDLRARRYEAKIEATMRSTAAATIRKATALPL